MESCKQVTRRQRKKTRQARKKGRAFSQPGSQLRGEFVLQIRNAHEVVCMVSTYVWYAHLQHFWVMFRTAA